MKGTRIPVDQIALMLANGDSMEDLLVDFPGLTQEDIADSLQYYAFHQRTGN